MFYESPLWTPFGFGLNVVKFYLCDYVKNVVSK